MSQTLYEQDFYAWTLQQAELLRSQTHKDLDWVNLAEELEDVGKNLKRELESLLKVCSPIFHPLLQSGSAVLSHDHPEYAQAPSSIQAGQQTPRQDLLHDGLVRELGKWDPKDH